VPECGLHLLHVVPGFLGPDSEDVPQVVDAVPRPKETGAAFTWYHVESLVTVLPKLNDAQCELIEKLLERLELKYKHGVWVQVVLHRAVDVKAKDTEATSSSLSSNCSSCRLC